jgi:hypothetical protein
MDWVPSWLRPASERRVDDNKNAAILVSPNDAPQPLSSTISQSTSISSQSSASIIQEAKARLQNVNDAEEEEGEDSGPILAIPLTGFTFGFGTGLYQSAKRSSLVFMAENAHRRPDTVQGWYFYNKTKVSSVFTLIRTF